MVPLHALDALEDVPRVTNVDAAVVVDVVHRTVVVVVDVDVSRVPVHVTAESGASARVAPARVVLGCPESAHDHNAVRVHAAAREVFQNELELVDVSYLEDE